MSGSVFSRISAQVSRLARGVRRSRFLLALIGGALLAPPSLAGQAAAAREYQIKAAFLFNFAQFVEWPAGAFAAPGAPLVIGILGDDPFGATLDAIVRGERVNERPLEVRRYERVEDATEAHILFVGRSEEERLPEILLSLANRGVLTVGEVDRFAQRGGMIGFVNDQNRIRLNVNLTASEGGNLTLSSRLLRAAEIVTPGA